jgi:N-acyl-D-aspartate/D-glutamate deacylase
MLAMSRNEAVPLETMQAGMPWDWESFPEYLDSVDRTPKGVNVMSYIGLQPIYAYVMGGVDEAKQRPASEQEMADMCSILVEAMEAGACGFSTQLMGENGVQRAFEVVRTDTLATVKKSSQPANLVAFRKWQDPSWKRETLLLR